MHTSSMLELMTESSLVVEMVVQLYAPYQVSL